MGWVVLVGLARALAERGRARVGQGPLGAPVGGSGWLVGLKAWRRPTRRLAARVPAAGRGSGEGLWRAGLWLVPRSVPDASSDLSPASWRGTRERVGTRRDGCGGRISRPGCGPAVAGSNPAAPPNGSPIRKRVSDIRRLLRPSPACPVVSDLVPGAPHKSPHEWPALVYEEALRQAKKGVDILDTPALT